MGDSQESTQQQRMDQGAPVFRNLILPVVQPDGSVVLASVPVVTIVDQDGRVQDLSQDVSNGLLRQILRELQAIHVILAGQKTQQLAVSEQPLPF